MSLTPHRAVADALALISSHVEFARATVLRLYPVGANVEFRVSIRPPAAGEPGRWRPATVAGAYVSLAGDNGPRAKLVVRIKGRGKTERTASYELDRVRHIARETIAS